MDKRTLKKIVKRLNEFGFTETRILGYKYKIDCRDNFIEAIPLAGGDDASSNIAYSNYLYTHGGRVYREAVNWCHEIYEHIALFNEAKDSEISIFAEKLEYNSQITRYFDEEFCEYDACCVTSQIEAKKKIYVLQWMSSNGYEVFHEYN